MSSLTRFFCVGAICLALLPAGCDRTVQPPASKGADKENSKQPSAVDQPEIPPAEKDQVRVDDSLVKTTAPEGDADNNQLPNGASSPDDKQLDQRVVTVEIKKSDDPNRMVDYLGEIDQSIEKLLMAQKQMEVEKVHETGIKLAKMKLAAAKHLSSLALATPEHIKTAIKAQLVALSHLSGLKDVQAAKQLEALAKELLNNPDGELKQQAQVVLFGFAVQNLQNGVITDPAEIVEASAALVADERIRGRLEMTSLQHAMNVMAQMGYHEQISQLQRLSFDAFSTSADQPLRHESWNRLVANSPAQIEFMSSLEPLGSAGFNSQDAVTAAKKLLTEFPNPVTLEMLASTIPSIEYAGQADFSAELSALIDAELPKYSTGVSANTIQAILTEHRQRLNWIGRPFEILEVVDMDGQPLAVDQLVGKVVLVSFGLTWDLNCMKELPFIERAYNELHTEGLEIVYVCLDGDLQQLQKFVKENAKPWKTYRAASGDARPLTQHFGITMFPHMMLVGRDGKVAQLHVRGERIKEQAKQLLAQ